MVSVVLLVFLNNPPFLKSFLQETVHSPLFFRKIFETDAQPLAIRTGKRSILTTLRKKIAFCKQSIPSKSLEKFALPLLGSMYKRSVIEQSYTDLPVTVGHRGISD